MIENKTSQILAFRVHCSAFIIAKMQKQPNVP